MKTRIISGIVIILTVAAIVTLGTLWNAGFIVFAVGLIAAGAVFELLYNVAGIRCKASIIGACVFAFLAVCTLFMSTVLGFALAYVCVLAIFYSIYAACMVIKNHKTFNIGQITALCGMPVMMAISFLCLADVIIGAKGIYYLLLLLNFSAVCDTGAYFVGVTLGKHKLCPEISPKKTVEGAIGGIVSSMVVSFIIAIACSKSIILLLLLTIPLCIIGMLGDLFASAIKRSVGIKDFSNLIPGHGGILDRLDSVIAVAPVLVVLASFGVL